MNTQKAETNPTELKDMDFGEIGQTVLEALRDNGKNENDSIFSEENIKKIYNLVLHGYELPTDIEGVKRMMPYSVPFPLNYEHQELTYQNYLDLFQDIRAYSTQWHYFESDIISQTLLLSSFSAKFSKALEGMIAKMETIPVIDRARQQLEYKTFSFNKQEIQSSDLIIAPLYAYMYGTIGIQRYILMVTNELDTYNKKVGGNIAERVNKLGDAIAYYQDNNLNTKECRKKIHDINKRINSENRAYRECNEFLNSGKVFIPFYGLVKTGIELEKRKKIKQNLNRLYKEREVYQQKYKELDKANADLDIVKDNITDLGQVTIDATSSLLQLGILWKSVEKEIKSIIEEFTQIDSNERLILFYTRMKTFINTWKSVNEAADNLHDRFTDAIKQYNVSAILDNDMDIEYNLKGRMNL